MSTFTLTVPTSPQFKSVNAIQSADIQNKIGGITRSKETVEIWKRVVQNTKVPASLLFAFASGSGFWSGYASNNYYGLMSVSTLYGGVVPDTKQRLNSKIILNNEKNKGRMTTNEQNILKRLGYVYNAEGKAGFPDVTETYLKNYEFNLLMGAIFLGQLIDGENYVDYRALTKKSSAVTDSRNNLLLERVIVLYFNSCNFDMPSVQMAMSGQYPTALSLIQAIESTDPSSAYKIKQIMGVGGWIDTIKKSATFEGFVNNYGIK
jgi:hypothetical protein